MNNELRQNSLHNLAHIANITQEFNTLSEQIKQEDNNRSGYESPVTATKTGKPKKIACVECRQQKSKCDAHEKHPNPCSRCEKKGLKCDLRSDYKRTYKRARIAQIEREFSELKKTLTANQAHELINKIPSLANFLEDNTPQPELSYPMRIQESYPIPMENHLDQGHQVQQVHQPLQPHQTLVPDHKSGETNPSSIPDTPSINRIGLDHVTNDIPQNIIIADHLLHCEAKTLDSITLQPETIRTLYLEYVNHYHPILPVVDVLKGPEKIYRLCPALFWVIMVVSLRRMTEHQNHSLLLGLSPIIKDILAEITISPIIRYTPTEEDEPILNACSVYSVQAFLIYTYWPPITSSLSADSSWNTIGLALFHAIRIGINVKNPSLSPSLSEEHLRTWILCNIVSQTIATAFGFPAFVQFDSSIWSSIRQSTKIPKSIRFMLEIASFEDQSSKTLNSNPLDPYGLIDPTERLPLLKVLLRQLDELELKLIDELPNNESFRKFQLLVARVHLLTYYFMDSSRIAFFELQKGLVRLYNSAIALINFAHMCQAKDKNFVKYLPSVYVLSLWQTSCIVSKLIHSPLKKVIDVGSGKQSYQAAITLAAKASILKHDMAHRSSGIMRNMWQVMRTLDENNQSNLTIDIRSRMSASVFFDCLFLLRQQVGMLKNNRGNQEQISGEEKNEDDEEEEEEEYGYQETAIESEDEQTAGSPKSNSGSNTSSKKKARSLSNTVNAESKARKIIRTTPLDPQPISANKRSTIFKLVENSNESSPRLKSDSSSSSHVQMPVPEKQFKQTFKVNTPIMSHSPPAFGGSRMAITGNTINRSHSSKGQSDLLNQFTNVTNPKFDKKELSLNQMVLHESPLQGGLENLEFDNIDINSDLLWKDVDSVMNDFGFHAQ